MSISPLLQEKNACDMQGRGKYEDTVYFSGLR